MISVIMPVYNVEKYVETAIESVLNQTYTDFELIVVNDGSTDKTLNKILKYKDNRISVKTTSNRGLSAARNLGLSLANGEYVYFIDSDDAISRNFFQICVDELEKGCDMVSVDFKRVTDIDETSIITSKIEKNELLETEDALHALMNEDIYQMAWSYFCRRKLFTDNQIEYPNGKLFEDNNTAAKLIASSKKISKLSLYPKGYFSRKRSGSITDVANKKHTFREFKDFRYVYSDEYKVLKKALGENDSTPDYWYFKQLVLLYVYYKHPTIDNHKKDMQNLSQDINKLFSNRQYKVNFKLLLQYSRTKSNFLDEIVRFYKRITH